MGRMTVASFRSFMVTDVNNVFDILSCNSMFAAVKPQFTYTIFYSRVFLGLRTDDRRLPHHLLSDPRLFTDRLPPGIAAGDPLAELEHLRSMAGRTSEHHGPGRQGE